jgi:maltooligosyltrehalose trehalohydrolase
MLFQGEEWAASTPFQYFTDHRDAGLGALVTEGRRREFAEFGWRLEDIPDPQAESTFLDSKLRWRDLEIETHASMQRWYRDLIAMRRRSPALRDVRLEHVHVESNEEQGWLRMTRGGFCTVVNFASRPAAIPLSATAAEILLAPAGACQLQPGVAQLAPHGCAIIGINPRRPVS